MSASTKIQSLIDKSAGYIQQCLEFWSLVGYDKTHGGYFEAVDFEGTPLPQFEKRFRIHPRNIFAHCAGTAHGYGDFLNTAVSAFSFIMTHCWQEGRGFATRTDATGTIVDPTVMTYDLSFVLLGSAWLSHVAEQAQYKQLLDTVWKLLNTDLKHPKHGFLISNPPPKTGPYILQNPHMHLFEALLELYVLSKEEIWLAEAQKLYKIYKEYFFNSAKGVIIEFFDLDFNPFSPSMDLVEPGHHFEWVWLLHRYETLSHEQVTSIPEIYSFAHTRGRNKRFLPYEVCTPDGTPTKSTTRMWAQTEQVKANLAMFDRSGEIDYYERAVEALENLYSIFCAPKVAGVWFDCFDDKGILLSSHSVSSTLYHLYIALQEFILVSKELLNRQTRNSAAPPHHP